MECSGLVHKLFLEIRHGRTTCARLAKETGRYINSTKQRPRLQKIGQVFVLVEHDSLGSYDHRGDDEQCDLHAGEGDEWSWSVCLGHHVYETAPFV
jgi:hypothetical protein